LTLGDGMPPESERSRRGRKRMPIWLYERESGAPIIEISQDQLKALQDALEEEFEEDADYYIDPDTLDYLGEQGLSASVLDPLRRITQDRGGLDIGWRVEP
jgi:hypothetical protein